MNHAADRSVLDRLKLSPKRMQSSEVLLRPCAAQAASSFFNKTGGTRTNTGTGAGGFFFNFLLL
jgi:hypothetical protein